MSKKKLAKKPNDIGDIFGGIIDEAYDAIGALISKGISNGIEKAKDSYKNRNSKDLDSESISRPKKWNRYESVVFSRATGQELDLSHLDLNRSTIVTGVTGSGKNVAMFNIIDQRLKSDLPVVFIGPKGDQFDIIQFTKLNKIYGRDCYVYSPNYKNTRGFNPIAEGTVQEIHDRILDSFHWSEQFYKDVASNALREAIQSIKDHDQIVTFDRILSVVRIMEEKADTVGKKNLIGLINKLVKVNCCSTSHLLNADDALTFSQIRKMKASLYIELPNLAEPDISKILGRIFLSSLSHLTNEAFKQKISLKSDEPDMAIVIDEFATFATPAFGNWLSQCRGANLSAIIGFQSLSQLDRVGEGFREQIMNNTSNFFIGLCNVAPESEYWAGIVGTKESEKKTVRVEEGQTLDVGSLREVKQYQINPQVIRDLGVGQFVVKSKIKYRNQKITDIYDFNLRLTEDYLDFMLNKVATENDEQRKNIVLAKKKPSQFHKKFEAFRHYKYVARENLGSPDLGSPDLGSPELGSPDLRGPSQVKIAKKKVRKKTKSSRVKIKKIAPSPRGSLDENGINH